MSAQSQPSSKRRKPLADITNSEHLVRSADGVVAETALTDGQEGRYAGDTNRRTRQAHSDQGPVKRRRSAAFDIASVSNESRVRNKKRIIIPSRKVTEGKESS